MSRKRTARRRAAPWWRRHPGTATLAAAVGATWTEAEIEAVLTYAKSRWEPWQRDAQPGTIGE